MTNDQLFYIYKQNLGQSQLAALRGVYNAGYHEGAALVPTANSTDYTITKSLPVAVVKIKRPD